MFDIAQVIRKDLVEIYGLRFDNSNCVLRDPFAGYVDMCKPCVLSNDNYALDNDIIKIYSMTDPKNTLMFEYFLRMIREMNESRRTVPYDA